MYATEQEALAALQKQGEDGWIVFDGQNCNDYLDEGESECPGWDGESRRCFCGNRRVNAIASQNQDGQWSAYAEAY